MPAKNPWPLLFCLHLVFAGMAQGQKEGALPVAAYSTNDTLYTVYYASNSATVSAAEKERLKKRISGISPLALLTLLGYCDDVGEGQANLELANKRVMEVYSLLLHFNVAPDQVVHMKGIGELQLPVTDSTQAPDQRGHNRKVEIHIRNPNPAPVPGTPKNATAVKPAVRSEFTDKLKVGEKLLLKGILFSPGRHIFLPESYTPLNELVMQLNRWKKYTIRLEGHVCAAGSPPDEDGEDFDTHTKNLSETRAKAVYDYLIARGISPSRLSYIGLRGNYPTKRGCDADRRVEVEITGIN
jgi:outer membrane protein OmpA-like peptidoglycan-associated protein